MIKRIRSLFAWRAVRNTGVWLYSENTVTGQREAQWLRNYQPLDRSWLRSGDVVYGPRGRYVIGSESEIILG
jgi:hypothetical protein